MLTERAYRELYRAAPDGVLVVGLDGVIRSLNPAAEAIFGYARGELEGEPVDRLVPQALRRAHAGHRDRYVRNPHRRPMGAGLELEGRRRDGSRVPVEISLSPWEGDDDGPMVICTVRDVTDRQRLRDFSRGALRSVEEERKRIARELHDDTAQRLATLMLRMAMLERADEAQRSAVVADVRSELLETVEGIKRIARGLRPPELEDLGLVLALQAHFRSLREASGFLVEEELNSNVEDLLDTDAKLVLYRIVQESLSNVVRHSGARRASVRVHVEDGLVRATVKDDGRGFSDGDGLQGPGLGLVGMQERALMIGGRMMLSTVPGEGTTVEVELPVRTGAGAHA